LLRDGGPQVRISGSQLRSCHAVAQRRTRRTDSKTVIQRVFILRVSPANLRSISTSQGAYCSSYGEQTGSVVAPTRNLHLLGSCFLTGLTAVFVATLHQAPAGVDAHICFSDLSSSFFPFCGMCILLTDPSTCCSVDVLLGNRFLIDRNRLGF
jgi:hypothetical protein